jgi:hypothetical protein
VQDQRRRNTTDRQQAVASTAADFPKAARAWSGSRALAVMPKWLSAPVIPDKQATRSRSGQSIIAIIGDLVLFEKAARYDQRPDLAKKRCHADINGANKATTRPGQTAG